MKNARRSKKALLGPKWPFFAFTDFPPPQIFVSAPKISFRSAFIAYLLRKEIWCAEVGWLARKNSVNAKIWLKTGLRMAPHTPQIALRHHDAMPPPVATAKRVGNSGTVWESKPGGGSGGGGVEPTPSITSGGRGGA